MMDLIPTPSQTIGPFFHLCLTPCAVPLPKAETIRLSCRILDGDETPVNDAMIEVWQPEHGYFARQCTNDDGVSTFDLVKPGRVSGEAPHMSVMIFARGLLKQLYTRIYLSGDAANAGDPVLALVPEDRRATLLAHQRADDPVAWDFEIRLCAECETVFFDV